MARGDRVLDVLRILASARAPVSRKTLERKTGISQAAFYRLTDQLKEKGFVEESGTGSNPCFRLSASVALGTLSEAQIAALLFVRQAVSMLEGSRLLRDLDALTASLNSKEGVSSLVALVPPSPLVDGAIFDALQGAYQKRLRLRCRYQGTHDEAPLWRHVDPLLLYVQGEQAYLEVFDLERAKPRTFKLTRISEVQLTGEPADPYPWFDPAEAKRHARKVWDAPLAEVVVRLSANKARFAAEWPLKRGEQRIEPQANGSVLVRAWLAGTEEALKWVLSWGAGASVVAPSALREAHQRELAGALAAYR